MAERITIIDFVDKYTAKYDKETFIREKIDDVWQETSYADTRKESRELAAAFMSLGLKKGERVELLSEGRSFGSLPSSEYSMPAAWTFPFP